MSPVHAYAGPMPDVAVAERTSIRANASQAPVALEITRNAPFSFSYTKVRLDTGEAIWRWPYEPLTALMGGLVDILA